MNQTVLIFCFCEFRFELDGAGARIIVDDFCGFCGMIWFEFRCLQISDFRSACCWWCITFWIVLWLFTEQNCLIQELFVFRAFNQFLRLCLSSKDRVRQTPPGWQKSHASQDPVKPNSRCALFRTYNCCKYFDYSPPFLKKGPGRQPSTCWRAHPRRLPLRSHLPRNLIYGFLQTQIVAEISPRSAAPPIPCSHLAGLQPLK